jgi:hypothetical protein
MSRRGRRVHIDLSSLTGEQAYLFADVLERLVSAIWQAHGDDMADFQGRVFPDAPPPPDATTFTDRDDGGSDDDYF